jgi:hypothetical protein
MSSPCWAYALFLDARREERFAEVAVYAAIIAALLGWRMWQYLKKMRLSARSSSGQDAGAASRGKLSARAFPNASGPPGFRARE